ncbi:hypothetical protein [Escherichia coli]|uniref:hypothetical protein n=1 Tax=Escherichia coli TaxID=562 RepID=UPI00388FEDD6
MIMIIIYIRFITTCVYAIKPREIINYDAGIVLIDLRQINVKATSDNTKSATLNMGKHYVIKEQNAQNNNPQHPISKPDD